jgi:hypothetical protein
MNRVFRAFLDNTMREAMELEKKSDILRIKPLPPFPAAAYLCTFDLPYLFRVASGRVEQSPGPVLTSIFFPDDYLRSVDSRLFIRVATVLTPGLLHPNIWGGAVCLGASFAPGTSLSALLWELHSILSYQNFTTDERNAMNHDACRLLRQNPALLAALEPKPFLRQRSRIQPQPKLPTRPSGLPRQRVPADLPLLPPVQQRLCATDPSRVSFATAYPVNNDEQPSSSRNGNASRKGEFGNA